MRRLLPFAIAALALLLVAGGVGWWVVFGPNTDVDGDPASLYIPRGASFSQAADSLGAVIGSRATLEFVAKTTGWGDQVKAGHYTIEPRMSNYDVLQTLRRGLQTPVSVTIPPGTRPEVAAAVAGRDMEFSAEDFLAALNDPALAEELGIPPGQLFGYLAPQTYSFYWLNSPERVITKIVQGQQRYLESRAADAAKLDLSADEVVTLASIVEWEALLAEEKAVIAGLYLNRLLGRTGVRMRLQADPTVQYAVIESEGQKRRLLFSDYENPHPYNTYRIDGLPPGPVTNPARSTIDAVLAPESHRYLYMVAQGDGSHVFSRTLTEHNRAAARYRALMRQRRAEQER